MTEIIVTLESDSLSKLQDEIMALRNERNNFDIIEFRGDYYKDLNTIIRAISMIRDSIDKPLLYTYRTIKEGGKGEETLEAYLIHLATIQKSIPIEYIDVEVSEQSDPGIIDQLKRYSKVIMSHHNFQKTPSDEEMHDIMNQMNAAHGDFFKVAYMPESAEDVERVKTLLKNSKEKYGGIVTAISMGSLGEETRTSTELPSKFTYGTLAVPQAPGQMRINALRKIYGGTE